MLSALGASLAISLAGAAQAQTCGWSLDIPGWNRRDVRLVTDGGHGLLAVSGPYLYYTDMQNSGALRLHHVLEQGRLDPADPPGGHAFYTLPAGSTDYGTQLLDVVPDASGGVWALAMHANPFLAHTPVWTVAKFRLHHVNGDGTLPAGWVENGLLLPVAVSPVGFSDQVSVVSDGAGGVIAAWYAQASPLSPRTQVRAQRFAADGSMLWPGGIDGVAVTDTLLTRTALRICGDGVGGLGVAVNAKVNAARTLVRVHRVLANGTVSWPAAGVSLNQLASFNESVGSLRLDAAGRWFVQFRMETAPAQTHFQQLQANGARVNAFSTPIGPANVWPGMLILRPDGILSLHEGSSGGTALQLFDEFGSPQWGPDVTGVPALPFSRPPLMMPGGEMMFVWSTGGEFTQPPPVVRAAALGADGSPLPQWPDTGTVVCGALYGHFFSDATLLDGSLVVAMGSTEFGYFEPRIMRMDLATVGVEPEAVPHALQLAAPSPNPSRASWTVRLGLPQTADVALELFDLAGRRVWNAPTSRLAAGVHRLDVGRGASLAPGLYRLRVRAGGSSAEQSLIRVR